VSHCLVKRLYGRTNKHDMTKQIGRHIRQLEHAQDGKKLNISNMNEVMMEQDSDAHHQISKSQNNPLNMFMQIEVTLHLWYVARLSKVFCMSS
jgi:hypothetical protein